MMRSSRGDGRKSSGYCSTVSVVVVVSVCLIGAWMMMSQSMQPEEDVGVRMEVAKDNKLHKVNEKYSKEFEDDSGDLSENAKKGSSDVDSEKDDSDSKMKENENAFGRESESSDESSQDEKVEEKKSDEKSESNEENEGGDVKGETTEKAEPENSGEDEKSTSVEQESEVSTDGGKLKTDDEEGKSEVQQDSSDDVKEKQETDTNSEEESENESVSKDQKGYKWKVCKVTAGPDYIPCLDNIKTIRKLPSTSHYEHRERHCPDEPPTCLVPLPEGYKIPVKWPKSREKIWFTNVPHTKLAEVKGHQNWVQVSGEYLTFPGGGTQFTHGALRYIDFIQKTLPDIAWGKRTRVILDVGCGVASFGGFLFDRDVLAMSLAPKDEHEAQTQFALERGIPAISAVMGTKRLPFPGMVFDVVHCARCRVPWHVEGGKLLLELNRLLRPGGYFVWSATPVYRKDPEDVGIWKEMSKLTKSMCWDLVKIGKDKVNGVSAAVFRKPTTNDCYENRTRNDPPLCEESDDRNSAWYTPLEACIHKVPTDLSDRGSQWPALWPSRVQKPPYWLESAEVTSKDYINDYKHWKQNMDNSYLNGIGIDWSSVRNVMDMKATYGGFAAALKDLKVWVMNVVPVNSADTLPIIFERGLFGIYHDWCESFSTYPRTYDLLHADHLFSDNKNRCKLVAVMAEVDRILRPEGWLVVRDNADTIAEVEKMAKSLKWKVHFLYSKNNEGLLSIQKTRWRPSDVEPIMSAIE